MPEFLFVQLPVGKVSHPREIPGAVTEELNAYAAKGWDVVNAVDVALIGKVGFLLRR